MSLSPTKTVPGPRVPTGHSSLASPKPSVMDLTPAELPAQAPLPSAPSAKRAASSRPPAGSSPKTPPKKQKQKQEKHEKHEKHEKQEKQEKDNAWTFVKHPDVEPEQKDGLTMKELTNLHHFLHDPLAPQSLAGSA